MIFFILPIYNEEQSIRNLIPELRIISTAKYKIIAINDGSSDSSLQVLRGFQHEDLVIETSYVNMNIGAVFSSGIMRALSESKDDNDIIIIMEADQTNCTELIQRLIFKIEKDKNDIAIASRYRRQGGYVNFPLMRRVYSYFANYLMRHFFPIQNVFDYTIFFRAYRIGVLRKAIKYLGKCGLIQSRGFVANAELLIKLSMFTNKITEIPFVYNYGKKLGKSKIRIIMTIIEYFTVILYLKKLSEKVNKWKDLYEEEK